jgi:ATP-binding cassette, subfamily B, bacterial MsbA
MTLIRRLLNEARPYWLGFAAAFAAMAVTAATEPIFAALMRPLLDNGFGAANKGGLKFSLWLVPVCIVALFLVRGLSTFIGTYALAWVSNNVLRDLRRKMFDRLLSLPTERYDQQSSGLLISRIVNEANDAMQMACVVLTVLVRDGLIVLGLLGVLLWFNWQLTLIVLTVVPMIFFVVRLVGKRIRTSSANALRSTGDMTRVVEEVIGGHKVVKIYGAQEQERQRFARVSTSLRGAMMRIAKASAVSAPLTQLGAAVSVSVVVTVALMQASHNELTVGGFASFITAMLMLLAPLKHLADINGPLQKGLASAEAAYALIDATQETDSGTQVLSTRAAGHLSFEKVCLRYAARDEMILDDVSLKVAAGQVVALVGASGSGKTSLMNLLPRFYSPSSGRVLLDGIPINELSLASLRAQIALVSQDIVLFNDSLAANVCYGLSEMPSESQIWSALRSAHLEDFVRTLPLQLQTNVGERGLQLSGGQRQRVAIARAVMKNAPILILDEATSALDSETEKVVQKALDELKLGRTTLVIAHRLSSIESADFIVVMDAGRIVETGTHTELLARGGVYRKLYALQSVGLSA